MPIVSRTLGGIQQTTGGIFAAFLCVDSLGREWRRSRSRFVDEATAQIALDAHDWTVHLENRDEQIGMAFVEAGGDPE